MQGVQDCTTVSATFKLLEGFEGILERPLIASELHLNHLRLLSSYAADLGAVIALFKANMARPSLPQNAAPYSGAIYWAHGLMDRVSGRLTLFSLLARRQHLHSAQLEEGKTSQDTVHQSGSLSL